LSGAPGKEIIEKENKKSFAGSLTSKLPAKKIWKKKLKIFAECL